MKKSNSGFWVGDSANSTNHRPFAILDYEAEQLSTTVTTTWSKLPSKCTFSMAEFLL